MKNLFVLCSVVLFASMFASCQNGFEEAYASESLYKAAKKGMIPQQDTTGFKADFIRIYEAMDEQEKEAYKQYREEQKVLEEIARQEYIQQKKDINAMLQD